MKNLIMVVCHKQGNFVCNDLYQPIAVGSLGLENDIPNFLKDNTGDNISDKNSSYCELTALYWVWKNYMDGFDNIGLCHYRRYFTNTRFNDKRHFLNNKNLTNYMKNFDVILPKPFIFETTVEKVYYEIGCGRLNDLMVVRKTLKEVYPEYYEKFVEILNRNQSSYCNMFVMSANNFKAYCEWLFTILGIVESKIDITGYNQQEKRVFGYLSEILLNVWVEHNKLRIKYLNIAYTERTLLKRVICKLKRVFKIKT